MSTGGDVSTAKADAYLKIAGMRERMLMTFLERGHDIDKARDMAYKACAFIEEGRVVEDDPQPEVITQVQPVSLEAPRALPAPTAAALMQAPVSAPADSPVRLGHKEYTRAQVEDFKRAWASPDTKKADLIQILGCSWPTVETVALRLNLGHRAGRRDAPHVSKPAGSHPHNPSSLEIAIDWYEAHEKGRSVIPSTEHPGSYALGEDGTAIITKLGLIAEINALRRRSSLPPFDISANGA